MISWMKIMLEVTLMVMARVADSDHMADEDCIMFVLYDGNDSDGGENGDVQKKLLIDLIVSVFFE